MTQYIDKSALVAEIERRRRDWRFGSSTEAKFKREECDDILSFLDTLEVKEEPVSKDLDEAARKAGQKYFPDEYNIWARPNYEAVKVEYAFKEGAKWQEEHLCFGGGKEGETKNETNEVIFDIQEEEMYNYKKGT